MNRRFVFLSMLTLLGCGSQPGPLTQTDYCNEYAQGVCSGVVPACLVTTATCMAVQLDKCTADAQYNAGRVFIPANAETCLNKVSSTYSKLKQGSVALSAADLQAKDQACGDVYRGPVEKNGPCTADADCLDGLICDVAKGYCGTSKLVAQGAGCANIGETCPAGFYCSAITGVWLCLGRAGLGGACDAANPCMENLRCSTGTCVVQLGIGEQCAVDQDCKTGLCEPYAGLCAQDVRFANHTAACVAMGGP
jgi:hypothetical protein